MRGSISGLPVRPLTGWTSASDPLDTSSVFLTASKLGPRREATLSGRPGRLATPDIAQLYDGLLAVKCRATTCLGSLRRFCCSFGYCEH